MVSSQTVHSATQNVVGVFVRLGSEGLLRKKSVFLKRTFVLTPASPTWEINTVYLAPDAGNAACTVVAEYLARSRPEGRDKQTLEVARASAGGEGE